MLNPKLKHIALAKELGDYVEMLIQQPLKPNTEQIDVAERMAQKLIFPTDTRYYAYQCLGVIEAFKGNESKAKAHFHKALTQSNEPSLYAMYAQSLRYLGNIKESVKLLNDYGKNLTTDLFSLNTALRLCIIYGQTTKAEYFMSQIQKLDPKSFLNKHKIDIQFTQLWQNTGIPEDVVLDYMAHAYQFAAERNINLRHPKIVPDAEDEHSFMYIFRDNDLTTEQRLQYDMELTDHMFSYMVQHKEYPLDNIIFFLGRYKDTDRDFTR